MGTVGVMDIGELSAALKKKGLTTKDLNFKIALLKYFWDNRDREILDKVSGVEKQKFLFFYNLFAFVQDKAHTFENLKAFVKGPVYYDINTLINNGDRLFLEQVATNNVNLDLEICEAVKTLIEIFGEIGVSDLSHRFDLWQKKYNPDYKSQPKGSNKDSIVESDISMEDKAKATMLFNELKEANTKFAKYHNVNNKVLLIQKENFNEIMEKHLAELNAFDRSKIEPVYVYLSEGELYFD